MTPADLRAAMSALRWSIARLAEALGCTETTIRRWLAGDATVPPEVAAWLRRRLSAERSDPPPRGWQRRTGRPGADQGNDTVLITRLIEDGSRH